VLGIASGAGITADAHDTAVKKESPDTHASAGDNQKFVLFCGPGDSRMALPLDALARLEEIPLSRIELSGERSVVQYRGQILPLIRVGQVLPSTTQSFEAETPASATSVPVLVLNHDGRNFGLVVDRIVDIVEQATSVRAPATREGVLCSTVIGERVTELLDVPAIWRMVGQPSDAAFGASPRQE
jgi:two-component system, chemotaxis family, sensor kinase CheA